MGAGEMGEDTIAKRADGPRANARTEDYDESGRIPSTLERYFALRDDVTLAFLFGSVARGKATGRSDVDVAVYFAGGYNLTTVGGITGDLETLLRRDVDLIVLNEANASVAWAALRGTPLLVRDRAFYLQYMLDVSREAEDFSELLYDLWRLRRTHRRLVGRHQVGD